MLAGEAPGNSGVAGETSQGGNATIHFNWSTRYADNLILDFGCAKQKPLYEVDTNAAPVFHPAISSNGHFSANLKTSFFGLKSEKRVGVATVTVAGTIQVAAKYKANGEAKATGNGMAKVVIGRCSSGPITFRATGFSDR
jgi:hypothetical protein